MPVAERQPRERVGSDAFNLEYKKETPKESLYDHIVSYIGEYRLRLQKYNYSLEYSASGFVDPNTGESMLQIAESSIRDKRGRGLPIHREEAELKALGILKNVMPFTRKGDTIFWASPPGPKNEGYGTYGFLFVGKISGNQQVNMTAIRVDDPTLEQYSTAMTIFTGAPTSQYSADSVLRDPRILQEDMELSIVDKVLEYVFAYKVDEKEKAKFKRILGKLNPVIEDLIDFVKQGTNEEKLQAFYALENYALQLKAEEELGIVPNYRVSESIEPTRLVDIIDTHGYEPPKVAGSCGSTDSSNSLFGSSLKKLLKELGIEVKDCECPDGNPDNHYHCPDCGKKYEDETHKAERTKECSCGFEFGC